MDYFAARRAAELQLRRALAILPPGRRLPTRVHLVAEREGPVVRWVEIDRLVYRVDEVCDMDVEVLAKHLDHALVESWDVDGGSSPSARSAEGPDAADAADGASGDQHADSPTRASTTAPGSHTVDPYAIDESAPVLQAIREAVERRERVSTRAAPSRRLPQWSGTVHGHRWRAVRRPRVLVVRDTSQSMMGTRIAVVEGILRGIERHVDLTILDCDTSVRAEGNGPSGSYVGGGWTNLEPGFAPDVLDRHRPDVLLLITDGNWDIGRSVPACPAVWALIGAGAEVTPEWGTTIRIAVREISDLRP